MRRVRRTAWREIVRRALPGVRLARRASSHALAAAESALSLSLPRELSSLLRETNGVGSGTGAALIWSVADLVSRNREFRDTPLDAESYGPFDSLLFVGEEGNGDLFAYDTKREGSPGSAAIVRWDHETDERLPIAEGLVQYFAVRAASVPRSSAARRQVVSIWAGRSRSRRTFDAYLAAGGSRRTSKDGLPLSRFQADYGLTLKQALGSEQRALFVPRPTGIRRLLADEHGGHSFAAEAAKRATALGHAKANVAILVYGLRHRPRKGALPRRVAFVGSFEFE